MIFRFIIKLSQICDAVSQEPSLAPIGCFGDATTEPKVWQLEYFLSQWAREDELEELEDELDELEEPVEETEESNHYY